MSRTTRSPTPAQDRPDGQDTQSETARANTSNSTQSNQTEPPRPRVQRRQGLRRGAAACERCRRRKQKCNGELPNCGSCVAAGADCVPSERLVVKPNCDCAELRNQVSELEAQIEYLRSRSGSDHGRSPFVAHSALLQGSPYRAGVDPELAPRTTPKEKISNPYRGRILRPTFSAVRGDRIASFSAVLSSPWRLWSDDAIVPEADDIDPSVATSGALPIDAFDLATHGEGLLETFFHNRWPQLPILHRNIFYTQHYIPLCGGTATSPLSSFQVYMCLAVAAAETTPASQPRFSHNDFFRHAVRDINAVLGANDLDCLQCLLLMCMYGSSEPQHVNMWYTVGLTLRIAVGIDLHRQESIAMQGLLQAEMAKRIFWSVYVMDRSISIAMGRPLGLKDCDISIEQPLQLTDDQLQEATDVSMATPLRMSDPVDTSTFLHVIKLRRINADIYTAFHSPGKANTNNVIADPARQQYYVKLNEWLSNAPRYPPKVSMLQTSEWFQIAYHQAVLSLYRPSQAMPVCSTDGLRLCVDSSISLINAYGALFAKNRVTYTFLALNSLFMAAVTLLHSLRVSSTMRLELSRLVAVANIQTCVSLLRGVAGVRPVGERCAQLIERLGKEALQVFDVDGGEAETLENHHVDTELLSWFGVTSFPGLRHEILSSSAPACLEDPTPSLDPVWNDLLAHGFGINGTDILDTFL
ncbi:hypothetical protein CPAR01_00633 [Colletotrichum paranaense]|uniref:Zn(2)-C6 fungal-type domain-containing protein n=2 Tax=Colletotrichum acutatum species complex TaxID=2707335 RepID=A0AAI9XHC8_9PEZI|nr:uncharacterized protein CPAR01_00633 [Colletotrichum paranaense]KAK1449553.1 hypothetical protein CMEL01_08868 [Colletotrichum melonis]KAK1546666.1 hypothetical protein CPAR01_00633 [Colletotrichum paranaense]